MNILKALRSSVRAQLIIACLALAIGGSGCSIKHVALDQVGDALAGSGTSFSSDDDPELIRAAAPFSLKLMEGILQENPRHQRLLFATTSGFTEYAYAFVQQDADEMEDKDLNAATELQGRARRLYLRARNYGLRGLELKHRDFEKNLRANPKSAVGRMTRKDVPLLYWTAVSWAAAVSVSKDNPQLVSELPCVEAMIDRALALDETFDYGAIHSFLITYEMSRQGVTGDPAERSRQHFQRAVQLTGGQQAAPFVAYAEAVSVQKQDVKQFQELLNKALAIDTDARPEWRLVNLVYQRRAKWLLGRLDVLFLTKEPADKQESK